jgi:hypothetical protein
LSSAPVTAARLRSIENGTTRSDAGGWPRWMCQAGLSSRCAASWPGKARSAAWYSSTMRGMTSQWRRFAAPGLPYMKYDSDSVEA